MSDQSIDPLEKPLTPVRVNYANGVLLDEDDFRAEQAYFRGRLSRAMAYLHGAGTVAGLDVGVLNTDKHIITVSAGLAVDRIGRLIELSVPYCIRAVEWFNYQMQTNPDGVQQSYDNSDAGDGNKAVVADLFVKFQVCESGMTPSFGVGNVDATDAFTAARLRDAGAFDLIMRTMPEAVKPAPTPPTAGLPEIDPAHPLSFEEGMAALHEFKLKKAWRETELWNAVDITINGGPEHGAEQNGTEIVLARVRLPAAGSPLRYDTNGDIAIDNDLRVLSLSNFELFWLMNATRGS